CGLKIDHKSLRVIDGVRLKCNCSLFTGDKKNIIYSESGEIIFSKNGISGIPVMNLSRFAINEISYGSKCGLILDMFPETGENELIDYLNSIITDCKGKLGTALSAIINDKMLKVMLRESGLDFDNDIGSLNSQNLKNGLKKLSALLKGYTVSITGDNSFENAQTTQGGVDLKEINENTMECKKYPGMYLAGEILDVDGMCGGYNLQWAWSTGYIAGSNV
ncbi:MAG: NAD(P)/FAD-dependent oxidoreductase, partial [Lachnospiraceae bacterium]|nr:NAD(P)/FAD-dependent oxidoreductase [Lachnospiraceae bacterium]